MKIRNTEPPYFSITEDWTSSVASYGAQVYQDLPDRFVISDSPEGKVATFKVESGDYIAGERAEVILGNWNSTTKFKIVGAEEAVEYHRMTVKLHSPWIPPVKDAHGRWGIVWQLHGPDWFVPGSPPMTIEVMDKYRLWLYGGSGSQGGYVDLSDSSINIDTWTAFVIEVKWRFDNTGYVRLWRKNEGATQFTEVAASYNVPTLAWRVVQSGYPHYIKVGYYRSASPHTNIVSHRKVIRTTRRDLAFA